MRNDEKPLLSIITIIHSDISMLKKTCASISSQSMPPFEHIIVASKVRALSDNNEVDKLNEKYRYFILDEDTSLYNAMNIGLKAAKGNCIYFLNGGDEFVSTNAISHIYNLWEKETCLVFRTVQYFNKDQYIRPSMKKLSKLMTNPAHQGFIAPIESKKIYFNEEKLINADTIWMKEYNGNFNTIISAKTLAMFALGGLSSLPTIKSIKMRFQSKQFKKMIFDIGKYIILYVLGKRFFYYFISKINFYEYRRK